MRQLRPGWTIIFTVEIVRQERAWGVYVKKAMAGCAVAIAVLAVLFGAVGPARADVLVNQPDSSVRVGNTFRVGVWYQQFSGGSRWYSVAVYNPAGHRILNQHGYAPSAHWRFWKIRVLMTGKYLTVYRGITQGKAWVYRVITHAHR
jgi:hypothetical protein